MAARRVGLDIKRMKEDLADPSLKKELEESIAIGESIGVGGTPAFVIDKYAMPSGADRAIEDIMEFELERAREIAAETGYSGEALYRELLRTAPQEFTTEKYRYSFHWEEKKSPRR